MQVHIFLFGQLTDIAGSNKIMVSGVSSTDELVSAVNTLYPAMAAIKYIVAVDQEAVHTNTALTGSASVALLPPFSGG